MGATKKLAPIMKAEDRMLVSIDEADPFGERSSPLVRKRLQLLGARILFESNDRALLQLVDSAFAGLPRHRLSSKAADLRIRLLLSDRRPAVSRIEPAPLALMSAAGLLGGATDFSDFVILSPSERTALVVVSKSMMRHPYHVRYEYIEFAVFTLAARVQRLASLHAACVGIGGRGILLMGPSGAGKSTVALHCMLHGFEFLSEDSVFVAAGSMRATGLANFLHVRADSLRWVDRTAAARTIRASPVIRRRSGARKYEIDLRRGPFNLAKSPLEIVSIVFLSPKNAARTSPLLNPLSSADLRRRLVLMQAYATSQPQWRAFSRNVSRLANFELRRGPHPMDAVEALRAVLARN